FLLFVWGGLAQGWYGAKLEHQSEQKTGKKYAHGQQQQHTKKKNPRIGRRRPRHRPPAASPPDGHVICRPWCCFIDAA
ncbi:unnamed protein product, partial [Menidia menidia]